VIFGSVLLLSTAISTLFMPSREEMRELEEQQRTARQARLAALQAKQLPKD
jgi:sensor histidine kinase YesM